MFNWRVFLDNPAQTISILRAIAIAATAQGAKWFTPDRIDPVLDALSMILAMVSLGFTVVTTKVSNAQHATQLEEAEAVGVAEGIEIATEPATIGVSPTGPVGSSRDFEVDETL